MILFGHNHPLIREAVIQRQWENGPFIRCAYSREEVWRSSVAHCIYVPSVENGSGWLNSGHEAYHVFAIRVARGLHRAPISLSKWKVTINGLEIIL